MRISYGCRGGLRRISDAVVALSLVLILRLPKDEVAALTLVQGTAGTSMTSLGVTRGSALAIIGPVQWGYEAYLHRAVPEASNASGALQNYQTDPLARL
jgi:hypothetical protein